MLFVFYVVVFIFGVCVGSLLNCVIYRLGTKGSFLKGRSFCPRCKQSLRWYDLIPVLSFVMLRGKCRYCKKRISLQYPLVELATGAIFLLTFHITHIQRPLYMCYVWIVSVFLIIVFVYDLKHFVIPDKIIYPAIGIVFLYCLFDMRLLVPLLAGISAAGFFFLIWLVSRGKWLGFGDVKLGFLLGIFLGFPNVLVALFFGFFIGAIIGVGLILLGKKKLKSEVPFGPFLVLGTFIALFWGERIISWYLGFL